MTALPAPDPYAREAHVTLGLPGPPPPPHIPPGYPPEPRVTAYLPDPRMRCTAYWYAARAGLLTGNGDLDFLLELGLQAARRARWEGIPEARVPEGPHWVHTWPEHIWSETADAMAEYAAEHGDYGPADITLQLEQDGFDSHGVSGYEL